MNQFLKQRNHLHKGDWLYRYFYLISSLLKVKSVLYKGARTYIEVMDKTDLKISLQLYSVFAR